MRTGRRPLMSFPSRHKHNLIIMSDEEQFDELERDVLLKIAEVKGYLDDLSHGAGETNRSRAVDRCLKEIDKEVSSLFTVPGCQTNHRFPQCKI